jgi:rhamnosyltransferase subunit B
MPEKTLHVLIAALGSYGDMHPFLGIAKEMRRRGHRVTIIAPAMYQALSNSLGFEFVPIGTEVQFSRFADNPDLWHPTKALAVLAEGVGEMIEPFYRAILDRYVAGETVLVYSSLVFGGRLAQETHGIPAASVHLSPSVMRSIVNPAYTPPLPIAAWQPAWFKKFLYHLADRFILDPALTPPLNAFRATLGLQPVRGIFAKWMHSPDRVIGVFPNWFAPLAPDWPPNTVLTGFPLYDESDVAPMDSELSAFLQTGDAPIAFTPGSAMRHGKDFFAAAVEACKRLRRRGLLISRHEEHIPSNLPPQIRHVSFAPFGQLLPQCSAIVHHGGIGTCAQALASGIPQVIMPMAHDQADNAAHLKRLGVATAVPAKKFNAQTVTDALQKVLENPAIKLACADTRRRFENDDSLPRTARYIEVLNLEK